MIFNRKMTFAFIAIILVVAIILLFVAGFITFFVAKDVHKYMAAKRELQPQITYGEFPLKITYEIDGEIFVYEDVYICEYNGIYNDWGTYQRSWKGYLKSTKKEDIVLLKDGDLTLLCAIGTAEYYMDDTEVNYGTPYTPPVLVQEIYDSNDKTTLTGIADEAVLEKYKIRLISWELSEPIENSFGDTE